MKLTKKQIKQIEELTENEYLFLESDNTLDDMMEEFGTHSEYGVYIFGEFVNEKEIRIYSDNRDETVIDSDLGIPIKWLKPLSEILKGGTNGRMN